MASEPSGPGPHSESNDLVTILEHTHLGAGVSEANRAKLAVLAELATFVPGETVIAEGERTPFLGAVVGGRLALRTHVAGRGDITYMTVEIGDIFGWSVLVPPHRSHAAVWAITDARALVLPASRLRETLASDPDLATCVYERTLAALGRRLSATRLQLLDLFETSAAPVPPGGLRRHSGLRLADLDLADTEEEGGE